SVVRRRPLRRRRATEAQAAAPGASDGLVLDVQDLRVTFPGSAAPVQAVRGVSFAVREGEIVGIVGASGSGKSMTALAVAQLVADPGQVEAAAIRFLGTDLQRTGKEQLRRLLGSTLAMVFQDPMSSFNPTMR